MANIDLDAMTYQELSQLIEAARTKREARQGEARAALIAEFQERAKALGITFNDLRAAEEPSPTRKPRKGSRAPVPAKFRGPDGATWSGRGRKPRWLSVLEAQGKRAEDYRI